MTHDSAGQPLSTPAALGEAMLAELARRFDGSEVEALALTGSYARGEASHFSDIDLLRFTAREPTTDRDRYRLWLVGERLVSVSATTIAAKRAEMARPETALWVVPGLRQARILIDREGRLAALIAEAHTFTRDAELRRAAAVYVSNTLADLAEEVHKLLGASARADESAMLYATLGLQQGLTRAALVARGALLATENAYFAEALRLAEPGSRWQRLLRIVIGYDAPPAGKPLARGRSEAALWLYLEAATLLADCLTAEDCEIVSESVARIRATLISEI